MTDHSHFSPSSANRWVVCQESLIPVEGEHYVIDDDDNAFASDGSAKHKLSDWCLNNNADPVDALLGEMEFHGHVVTTDMAEASEVYVSHVRKLQADDPTLMHIWFEERVYIEDVHEDMYGTLDCALFSEVNKHLIVGDAKFGWEIVEVEGNWQLRSYAIGKVRELEDMGYEIERVTCFICQPTDAYQPVKAVEYSRDDLRKFARTMKKATKGTAVKAGNHCKRCPRAHFCDTLENFARELTEEAQTLPVKRFNEVVTAMTPEKISEILDRKAAFDAWFAAVASWAKQLIILGTEIPNYELKGGLGNRIYRDLTEAENVLLALYGDGIYEPRTLRSPAQIEKIWKDAKPLLKGTGEKPGLCYRPPLGLKLKRKN